MQIKRLLLILCASGVCFSSVLAQEQERPVDLVLSPFRYGQFPLVLFRLPLPYPSAWSTFLRIPKIAGAWGSGYLYNTEEVKGLSHVHAWQLSGVSVMPISSDQSHYKFEGGLLLEFFTRH